MKRRITLLLAAFLFVFAASAKKAPKYVFYFIGDGMGVNQVMATQYYLSDIEGTLGWKPLCFTQFPYAGMVITHSANNYVTDSSAAGTALASGQKTDNNVLGVLPDRKTPCESIAEMAHKKGLRVAIGTTVCIDHATPGVFYAHQASRDNYHEIGIELSQSGFEFFGGADFHTPFTKDDSDEGNYVQAEKAGYTILHGYAEYENGGKDNEKVILFDTDPADDHYCKFAVDRRDDSQLGLEQITTAAIDFMMKDPKKGFFMMMEGGKIDQACHGNDAATTVKEIIDFDNAIKIAYEFYLKHKDETLIVVTADHETGAMGLSNGNYRLNAKVLENQIMSEGELSALIEKKGRETGEIPTWDDIQELLKTNYGFWDKVRISNKQNDKLLQSYVETFGMGPQELKEEEYYKVDKMTDEASRIMSEIAQISWGTGTHSGGYVPIYAIGAGSEQFTGQMDNTEIPMKIKAIAKY
ncbi:MAG: alkaline phosphatase [Bacteroidaceae bacterium]|nr:alkaline phosphatase [Bacteroidaceae bacterium]